MEKTNPLPRVHYTASYLTYPVHRVSVDLIGAGGTGSAMLNALARIDHALYALGHQGLFVTTYDPDTVSEANIGRQLFAATDIGRNKAECLTSKINRFYGLDWEAKPGTYRYANANIVITCVDNIKCRTELGKMFRGYCNNNGPNDIYYWLDCGNARRTGQVLLGSAEITQPRRKKEQCVARLPIATEEFDYSTVSEKDSGPSCSLAEALSKQDLFINTTIAQLAGSLLWSLLHDGKIAQRGFYVNLEEYRMLPIKM